MIEAIPPWFAITGLLLIATAAFGLILDAIQNVGKRYIEKRKDRP